MNESQGYDKNFRIDEEDFWYWADRIGVRTDGLIIQIDNLKAYSHDVSRPQDIPKTDAFGDLYMIFPGLIHLNL